MLSRDCFTTFEYTTSQRILHNSTGRCVFITGTVNGAKIVLSTFCSDERSEWIMTRGSLKNPSSNMCIHPVSGGWNPNEGEYLVLYDPCGENRIAFKFRSSKLNEGNLYISTQFCTIFVHKKC